MAGPSDGWQAELSGVCQGTILEGLIAAQELRVGHDPGRVHDYDDRGDRSFRRRGIFRPGKRSSRRGDVVLIKKSPLEVRNPAHQRTRSARFLGDVVLEFLVSVAGPIHGRL